MVLAASNESPGGLAIRLVAQICPALPRRELLIRPFRWAVLSDEEAVMGAPGGRPPCSLEPGAAVVLRCSGGL